MQCPNFRLRIDLSKFFRDARRSCWIYVDVTKIQQIVHMKRHISGLFNIREPFHLLLNDTEYLPPTEDVRVLKENETILVIPGSGIDCEAVLSTSIDSDISKSIIKLRTCNGDVHNKDSQRKDVNVTETEALAYRTLDESDSILNNTQPASTNNTTVDMTFHTVIEDADTDSKVTDCSNLTEDCSSNLAEAAIPAPFAKRKRVRKRRPKNNTSRVSAEIPNANEECMPKKPKIVDSVIIPSGKHIRFDNVEEEETNIAKKIERELPNEYITKSIKSYINQASSPSRLSTLLALGQSSTPITFTKKAKDEDEMGNLSKEQGCARNLNKTKEVNVSAERCSKETDKKVHCKNLTHADLEKIPIMTRKPLVGETIAFKTLKLGTDYTPQMSNFIIAEVLEDLSFCSPSETYTFRMLKGKEEIDTPFGKFSLSEEESASQNHDDRVFKYEQIQEPRLIV